jgi:hypothetical protein
VNRGKKPKKAAEGGGSSRLPRRLLVVALTIAALGGLIWGITLLGDAARRGLGPRDRYTARFADIDCESPPGLDRAGFLSEVRYVSNFPESFQSLDPELQGKLAAAFSAHPWVAGFDGASVDTDGKVAVKLRFRVPTLAVQTGEGVRIVDAAGVLLPSATADERLPELVTAVPPPDTPAGQRWANEIVKRAIELVDAHHPRKLEKTPQGWRLTMPDGKVLAVEK